MSDAGIFATEGVSEATQAFEAALDAETPSRSRRSEPRKEEDRQDLGNLFPNRQMDRRETEGGADDEPEIVKQRRLEARRQRGEDDSGPRDPTEGNDEDEEDPDAVEGDEEEPEDEDQPDDEGEDESEDEGDVPGALDLNTVVQVTVDGQPVEVTLGEAMRGYIRQETFHQRMSQLGQGVQELNASRQHLVAAYEQHAADGERLAAFIEAIMPQEPDWNALFNSDPSQAAKLKFQWDGFQQKRSEINGMIERARANQQREQMIELHRFAEANRTWLAQQHPEWKNEKVWKRDHDSMRRTARAAGYTDQEIAQLYDARAVTILLKAAAHDRMMAAKPRPVRQGFVAQSKNGSTPSRNLAKSFERAERRLSRSGSVRDAAAVFERILDNEG